MARRPRGARADGAGRKEASRGGGSRTARAGSSEPDTANDSPSPDTGRAGADPTPNPGLGRLTIVATPIGNLGDLSPRALAVLEQADILACEDTSVGARLLAANGLRRSILRLDEHAPQSKITGLAEKAAEGSHVVYFSDAGTPGVSDPGPQLVDAAYDLGVLVDAIPGPSAALTALMLSGFYAQKFAFLGFLSRKAGAIRSELAEYVDSTTTIVFFEAATRLQKTLAIAHEALGDRRVAVCREMTKAHQEVTRCKLSELIGAERTFKGECTVVLEGKRKSLA